MLFRSARSFTFCLDRGGMRRSLLRRLENKKKHSIIHIASFNLGLLLQALFGFGTAKGWAAAGAGLIFDRIGQMNLLILVIWLPNEADVQIVP